MYSKFLENPTKETVYEAIKTWEQDAEEGFTDYFDTTINTASLMFWCLGKGYIDKTKMDLWLKDLETEAMGDSNILSECLSGYECDFAIFPTSKDMTDEQYYEAEDKGLKVVAEFIASNHTYIRRFTRFLAGWNWSSDWDDIPTETAEESYQRAIEMIKKAMQS